MKKPQTSEPTDDELMKEFTESIIFVGKDGKPTEFSPGSGLEDYDEKDEL